VPVTVRKFRESDRELLKDLTARTFKSVSIEAGIEEQFGLINGKDWAYRKRRHIDWDCDANPNGVLVAVATGDTGDTEGRVLGYITTRVDHDTKIGWIPNLAVDVGLQGQGIGKQLMNAALAYLRGQGMEGCRIETLAHNPVGTKFYPAAGFVEVARQVHYFRKL
jgi:ribosomal protein S18 acetylase RimI-like enzyme